MQNEEVVLEATESELKIEIHIYNKTVYLDSMIDRTGQINKYLVENGVTVN